MDIKIGGTSILFGATNTTLPERELRGMPEKLSLQNPTTKAFLNPVKNPIHSIVSLFLFIPLALVSLVKFPKCPHTKPIPMKQYFGFFTKPAILLVGLFLFFQSAVEAIVPVWTPTYLKETFLVSYDKGLVAAMPHFLFRRYIPVSEGLSGFIPCSSLPSPFLPISPKA